MISFTLFIQIVLLILLSFVCVYTVVDRICKSKETCTMAESFAEYKKIHEKKSEEKLKENTIEKEDNLNE